MRIAFARSSRSLPSTSAAPIVPSGMSASHSMSPSTPTARRRDGSLRRRSRSGLGGGIDMTWANRLAAGVAAGFGAGVGATALAGSSTGPGAVIPDAEELTGAPAFVSSDVDLVESISVESLTVQISGLVHSWVGDVSIELTHVPSGRSATLVFRVGVPPRPEENEFGDSSNYGGDYVFTDGAAESVWEAAGNGGTLFVIPPGAYFPSGEGQGVLLPSVPEFDGINAQGTWRITIGDWAAGDTGAFVSWTLEIEGSKALPCAETGSCFEPHAGPGCDDLACCQTVCGFDPTCCEVGWSEECVSIAVAECVTCAAASTGSCCETQPTGGCENTTCCIAICENDIFCCTMAWDASCVQAAKAVEACNCIPDPEPCPGIGCCTLPHAGAGCSDAACCNAVCIVLPVCCETSWDSACANEAQLICCPSDINGDGVVDGSDLGALLSVINQPGDDGDFDCDGFIDGGDLGVLLASWGPCGG